jgi:hypothetical protein
MYITHYIQFYLDTAHLVNFKRTRQQFLRMLTTGSHSPREWLGMDCDAVCHVNHWYYLIPFGVLRSHKFNSSEKRGNDCEQACGRNMPSGTSTTTKTEARCARVANGGVKCALGSEISRRIEDFGIGIIFGVVKNSPIPRVIRIMSHGTSACLTRCFRRR